MPEVLRSGPYRFSFYSREPNEPAHVHVRRERYEAKFWLTPVELARASRLPRHELNTIQRIIEQHRDELLEQWHEHFDEG
jgi:hypothetical protein